MKMEFTKRFLKLPIKTVDPKDEDLGLKDRNEQQVTQRVLPGEIESYFNDWEDDKPVVNVTTKGGDKFLVYMGIKEFEKTLNEFSNGN